MIDENNPLLKYLDRLAAVPSVTKADAMDTLQTLVREFFRKSRCWRTYARCNAIGIPGVAFPHGWAAYPLPSHPGRYLGDILRVNGHQSEHVEIRTMPDARRVILVRDGARHINALCVWEAERGNEADIPTGLLDRWGDDIAEATRETLSSRKDRNARGRDFLRDFNIAIATAAARADRETGINQGYFNG